MSSDNLRKTFLAFFKDRGHVIVPSSSLIPDDPSVLLTTAGMQQFKPYYTGALDPMTAIHGALGKPLGSTNAVSIQKSFRTSDIDEVGDESHLTFFEMLGNFSFGYKPGETRSPEGGYFKKEAIEWAWEFVHHVLNVPMERITISVFEGDAEVLSDKESHDIWRKLGIPDEKITFGNRADNFWGPTGNEGPCGPTTEIYIDGVELWNIVFNEYYMHPDKRLEPLKIKGVDTGMGLERLALVMQYPGHPEHTIFATDLFKVPFGDLLVAPGGVDLQSPRIVADHLRGAVFLIADGVKPSNKEAGYVLRRLIRRAIVHLNRMYVPAEVVHKKLNALTAFYGDFYPELSRGSDLIAEVFEDERGKFQRTLDTALGEFYKRYPEIRTQDVVPGGKLSLHQPKIISGEDAFYFHQSYGLTIDIIRDLAKDGLHRVDEEGFEREFKKHQEISRAGAGEKFGGHGMAGVSDEAARRDPNIWKMTRLHTATHLLHQALRDTLGSGVRQMGSDINPERTRFDFAFDRKVADGELRNIEAIVNKKIGEDLFVKREVMTYDEAIRRGALAFFKEKYPKDVSVYSIGEYSKELCGGPHVSHTAEIGKVKILKEEAVGRGVRRIRAAVE